MGIVNRDGALYMATGFDNSGLYSGRREAMGIIKAMASQITSFDVFSGIGISAATAFASAAKSSYDFEKEFQKNMLEVATISTQVTDDMTGFMNQVMAITQEIPIKAPDAAKALYQIVSAGHDGANGMKILEVSAKSAVGGLTDTATAADAITTVLNAYKMSAGEANNISDQLFTTVRLGKTTFGELGQSIAQVAPIAASYGVEIDQVLAAVASLTKQGTPTAQAMTQIRAAIIGTSKVLGDGAFASRTFQEALAEVATRANGSESKLRELVPEIEAVNGVLGMTGKNAQAAASDLGELQSAAGATEAAFGKMKDEVGNQMILLSNNIQVALRPMGQAILKEVSDIAKTFNDAFENGDVERALKSLGDLIVIVTGAFIGYEGAVTASTIAQNIHTKALVVSRLASMQHITTSQLMTNAIKAQTVALLKNVAALATNPYVLAAAAISALGYGIYKYATQASVAEKAQMKYNERLEEQNRLAEELKNKTEQLLDSVKDETKTDYERNKALKALKDLYPQIFEKYDIEALKLADLLKIKKEIAEIDGQRSFLSDKSYFANLVSKRDKLNAEISYRSENYGNGQYKYGQFYGKTVNELKKEREEIQHEIDIMYSGLQDQAEEIWNRFTPKEVKIVSLENNIKALEEEKAEIEARIKDKENKGLFVDALDMAKLASVNKELTITNEKIISLNKTVSESEKKDSSSISKEISDATKKVSTLKQELADLRSGKTSVEAGKTVQSAIEEKTKELKEAEDALATLTGKDKSSDKKFEDEQKKQLEKQKAIYKELFDLRLNNQQAEIDLMQEGSEKKIAQMNLNYDKEIAAILTKEKEWKDAQGGKLTKEQTIEIRMAKVNAGVKLGNATSGIIHEQIEAEERAMNEYLKKYGTYLEKRQAITELYSEKIKKATTEGERLSLGEEMKKELAAVDDEAQKKTSIITKLFSDMSKRTVTDIRAIADEAQEMLDYINRGEFKTDSDGNGLFGLTKEQFDILSKSPEKLQAVKDEIANVNREADRCETSFNKVSNGLKKVFAAGNDAKKLREGLAEIEEGMNEIMQAGQFLSNTFSKLGDSFGGVFSGIADGLNVAMDAVSSAMDGAKAGAMFGPIGSAAGAAIGVVTSLASAIAKIHDKNNEKRIERLQDQIDTLDKSYEKLDKSIQKAYSNDASKLIDQQNKLLEQQKVLIQQQIREEEDKKKTDKDRIKEWREQIDEINNAIAENKEKAKDAIFGEDLKSAIDDFAQAYVDAWAAGEDRAKSMKDIAKNMIKQMIVELIKSKDGIGPAVEQIRDKLLEFWKDGVITGGEQAIIDKMVEDAANSLDSKLGWADKYLKGDDSSKSIFSSDSISDTIIDGLKSGKSGIKDFASSFEDMMREAVLNSLKTKYLEGPLKEFQKKFSELSESGGQLTEAEIEELRDMYADIISGAKDQFDSLKEISGLDFTGDSDNSLKGAYTKASQESITLLAGQTGAVRVLLEDIRGSMQPIREQMRLIYEMQSKGWEDVKAIRELTVKIDKNSEQVATNTRMIHEVASKISENTRGTVDALEGTINVKVKM